MYNIKKVLSLILTVSMTTIILTSCGDNKDSKKDDSSKIKEEVTGNLDYSVIPVENVQDFKIKIEAEDARISGNLALESSETGFSGTGYVTNFKSTVDTLIFDVEVSASSVYNLNFFLKSTSDTMCRVFVDDKYLGGYNPVNDTFSDGIYPSVFLAEGKHTVEIRKVAGTIMVDYLEVTSNTTITDDTFVVSPQLVNKNASDPTKRLMSFLTDVYGKYIISGQYADKSVNSPEFTVIKEETGKTPAIVGLDLMEASPSRVENGSSSNAPEVAIDYYNNYGGIVAMSWHWNAPSKYLINKGDQPWYKGFYTEATTIDLAKIMSGEDKDGYDLLVSDIDAIAVELKELQDAGVPIIWRPLHEASGGWFWWGASGPEAYKQLWNLVYDRLTNYHKLNNLIWCWNGQASDWYPGDDTVDIIGEDIYPGKKVYSSQVVKYEEAIKYTDSNKIVAMSENGCHFDPDLAFRDNARWSFFSTWSGEFVCTAGVSIYSEEYTEKEMLKKVYNHERVITLDELPNLKVYPIRN